MFRVAKKMQRSIGVAPSAALHECHVIKLCSGWFYSASLLSQCPPDKGHDLSAGAVGIGTEGGICCTLGDVLLDGPQDRLGIVGVGLHVGKGIDSTGSRDPLTAPQERHNLSAGAGHIGAERGIAGALGDAVLHSPQHRVVVIAASLHIRKGHGAGLGRGAASGTPLERDGLGAGADTVGVKGGIGSALGDTVLHGPRNSLLIVTALRYIHKHAGLGVAVGLHKDGLNGVVALDILKGVGLHRADALAVDLHVGDGIARIRGKKFRFFENNLKTTVQKEKF